MYRFFLNNSEFPIPPKRIRTSVGNRNEVLDIASGQQINLLKSPGLTEIEFTLVLPKANSVHCNVFKPQGFYLDLLERVKKKQLTVEFVILRDINDTYFQYVTLEEYSIVEEDVEMGDISVDVVLKHYIPYDNVRLDVKVSKNGMRVTHIKREGTLKRVLPKTTVVRLGETMPMISKRVYGDESQSNRLCILNNIKNPLVLKVGSVIKLEKG